MLNLDNDNISDLAQKRFEGRQHRSEAVHRLYWSSFMKMMAPQVTEPRRKSQVWMRVRWFLEALRRWWHERSHSGLRTSEKESRVHPLISGERQV